MDKADRLEKLKPLLSRWNAFTLDLEEADKILSEMYSPGEEVVPSLHKWQVVATPLSARFVFPPANTGKSSIVGTGLVGGGGASGPAAAPAIGGNGSSTSSSSSNVAHWIGGPRIKGAWMNGNYTHPNTNQVWPPAAIPSHVLDSLGRPVHTDRIDFLCTP